MNESKSSERAQRSKLFSTRRLSTVGAPPGTLIAVAEDTGSSIEVFSYDADGFEEFPGTTSSSIHELRAMRSLTWINVIGVGNADLLLRIAEEFDLHHLALEDVLNTHQRPKIEEFDDHLFIVLRMVTDPGTTDTEQVSIFIGKDYVLSIQEKPGDCFEPVRDRIRRGRGLIRNRGSDYLCYALIDAVIDAYFPTLEILGENLEDLEETITSDLRPVSMATLHEMRREFLAIRRAIWPHREMLNTLVRDDHELIVRDTQVYLRDCYDHTIQLMDIMESYREVVSDLVDVYISSVNTKLNETMKVLTMIATVFMPLGFIASLYGMNFDRSVSGWNMPELGFRYGYPIALSIMAICAAGLTYFFWRKGWFASRRDRRRAWRRRRF